MSRKYKFYNPEGLYFVSFSTVYWISIFIRENYAAVIVDSLNYCIKQKGMEVYAWCLMPNHMHLIFKANEGNPGDVLGDFKRYTSKRIQKLLSEDSIESRRRWLLSMMKKAGEKKRNIWYRQLWQHHNQPIELTTNYMIDQKVNYIHQNPVKSGFVREEHHWKYSSAIDYADGKGLVDVVLV